MQTGDDTTRADEWPCLSTGLPSDTTVGFAARLLVAALILFSGAAARNWAVMGFGIVVLASAGLSLRRVIAPKDPSGEIAADSQSPAR